MISPTDPMRHGAWLAGTLALLVMSGAACDPEQPSTLWGTIAGSYGLKFDRVRAYRIESELTVVYEKSFELINVKSTLGKPVMNQVLRLTVDLTNTDVGVGKTATYDAAESTRSIASIKRYVIELNDRGEPVQGDDFPEISKATLTFDELGADKGGTVRGELTCEFVTALTLVARFDTVLSNP